MFSFLMKKQEKNLPISFHALKDMQKGLTELSETLKFEHAT